MGGRELTVWSTRGACWLEEANVTLDGLASIGLDVDGIDLDQLAYATAGRANVAEDPPYFATVLWKPMETRESLAALALYGGVLGFVDLNQFLDTTSYQEAVIAGKSVLVGDKGMLTQDEHLQGAPYLYETEDYLFVILTSGRRLGGGGNQQVAQLTLRLVRAPCPAAGQTRSRACRMT